MAVAAAAVLAMAASALEEEEGGWEEEEALAARASRAEWVEPYRRALSSRPSLGSRRRSLSQGAGALAGVVAAIINVNEQDADTLPPLAESDRSSVVSPVASSRKRSSV